MLSLGDLVGKLIFPKKGHFYHQNSYKGIDNYLLDRNKEYLENTATIQEWSMDVSQRVNANTGNIAINAENIAKNSEAIESNAEKIATNEENIATNAEKISALEDIKVLTCKINFDYTTNSCVDDKIYWVQNEDDGHYSYLVLNEYNFEVDDDYDKFSQFINDYFYSGLNALLLGHDYAWVPVVFEPYMNLTVQDTAYSRSNYNEDNCITISNGTILILHMLSTENNSEDIEITLTRKNN